MLASTGAWSLWVHLELISYHVLALIYGACALVFISPIESAWKAPIARWVAGSRFAKQLGQFDPAVSVALAATAARGMLGLMLGCLEPTLARWLGACGDGWCWSLLSGGGDRLLCAVRFYCGLVLWLGGKLTRHFQFLVDGCADDALAAEQAAARRAMLAWRPPPAQLMETLLGPYELLLRPECTGMTELKAQLKGRPALFVMNHSLGGIEMPLTIKLLHQHGIFVRGLSDHLHFSLPVWGDLIRAMGGVDGTRANCSALMAAGKSVLVYPGGAHEVMKGKNDEKYDLMWKERLGFARLAVKHKFTVVPCCCVGSEDMLDIVRDIPIGWLRKGLSVPLIKPPHPKRLQKLYFCFGAPIETASFGGGDGGADTAAAKAVRDATRDSLKECIRRMRARQASDPERLSLGVAAKNIRAKMDKLRADAAALLGGGGAGSIELLGVDTKKEEGKKK